MHMSFGSALRLEYIIPDIVITTPITFKGVSCSSKKKAAIDMVVASFAIPAMDIGTTPTRSRILIFFSKALGRYDNT